MKEPFMPQMSPEQSPVSKRESPSIGEKLKDPIGTFLRARVQGEAKSEEPLFADIPAEQRAEMLGELYREIVDAEKAGEEEKKTENRTRTTRRAEKPIERNLAVVAALYHDPETKKAYLDYWQRHKDERREVNGSYEQYRALRDRIAELENDYDVASRSLFARRGERSSAMEKLLYQRVKNGLERARGDMEALLEQSPKLAAQVSYERLAGYNRELSEGGFMWLPSRRRILEETEQAALLGRPVLMLGESGTGKTSLVMAAAEKLTGQRPFKAQGGPSTRLQDSLAVRDDVDGKSCLRYRELGQALTGKETSLDDDSRHEGGVYFDDEFNNRPSAVQMEIIKSVSGVRPGTNARLPLIGLVDVAPHYAFVAAGNPPSERYDREPMDPAVRREFGAAIPVGYVEQSEENPELYEAMLAALMDKNGRLRFAKEELTPAWDETKESVLPGGRKERILDTDPTSGGALWRFAQAVGQIHKSFARQETVLAHRGEGQYLSQFTLDPGVAFGWLRGAVEQGYRGSLGAYLNAHIAAKLEEAGISEDDAGLARELFEHFGFSFSDTEAVNSMRAEHEPRSKNMTPEEIGLLSPRVKYLKAKNVTEVRDMIVVVSGKPVKCLKEGLPEAPLGMERVESIMSVKTAWRVTGVTKDHTQLVIRSMDTDRLIAPDAFLKWPEQQTAPAEQAPERQRRVPREHVEFQKSESERLQAFFGRNYVDTHGNVFDSPARGRTPLFEAPLPPTYVTPEQMKQWEQMGFALRYLPKVRMIDALNLPGWQHKPNWDQFERNVLDTLRNLPENRSNPMLQGSDGKPIDPLELLGKWMLVDTRDKPNYQSGNQTYKNDQALQQVLARFGKKNTRASIDPSFFDHSNTAFWHALKETLRLGNLPAGAVVRLPRVIEANVLGQHPGSHRTNTHEWCEEKKTKAGRVYSSLAGHGGASHIHWLGSASTDIGFRPLVVLP
jgi:MoxR-like ATPase